MGIPGNGKSLIALNTTAKRLAVHIFSVHLSPGHTSGPGDSAATMQFCPVPGPGGRYWTSFLHLLTGLHEQLPYPYRSDMVVQLRIDSHSSRHRSGFHAIHYCIHRLRVLFCCRGIAGILCCFVRSLGISYDFFILNRLVQVLLFCWGRDTVEALSRLSFLEKGAFVIHLSVDILIAV